MSLSTLLVYIVANIPLESGRQLAIHLSTLLTTAYKDYKCKITRLSES